MIPSGRLVIRFTEFTRSSSRQKMLGRGHFFNVGGSNVVTGRRDTAGGWDNPLAREGEVRCAERLLPQITN